MYVNTHGNTGCYYSDSPDYAYLHDNGLDGALGETAEEDIFGQTTELPGQNNFDTLHHRVNCMNCGTTLPPFNAGTPPITFAFIDGCKVGNSIGDQAVGLLFPQQNAYSAGVTEDQAVLAYMIDVDANWTSRTVAELYAFLATGFTVDEARSYTFEYVRPPDIPLPEDWMALAGDPCTTIHGVYMHDYTYGQQGWYR